MERKEMIYQLSNYGYSKATLEAMPTRDLVQLLKKNSKDRILEFLKMAGSEKQVEIASDNTSEYIGRELENISRAVAREEIDFLVLYKAIEKIFFFYGLNEATELVLSQVSDKHYKQITQITELIYRSYQESLLEEIEELCREYPPEEQYEQMKIYSKKREDISFLRDTIQTIKKNNNQTRLTKISQLKFEIIHDYFPDSLYENYEEYYEDEDKKNEIIERIMSLTNAYRKSVLKNKKIVVLRNIEAVLLRDRDRENEEKTLIKHYTKKFAEIVNSEDELAFSMLLKESLDSLDERDVKKIIDNFDLSNNPILQQRYNILMRNHKPK
ncbi:hypothetical protein [Helicobacter mesocricetorum]|uniref:hypothetical protein n=1 Tax=Helicobacter mesocricetorum TaxID=87012 RepID=UPI000CF02FFE|nr:hypothetical protein [Helicobacter mesocricetorum]